MQYVYIVLYNKSYNIGRKGIKMEIDFLSSGFIVPSILNIIMLMLPITVFSSGILSWFRTALYATLIYAAIVFIGVSI